MSTAKPSASRPRFRASAMRSSSSTTRIRIPPLSLARSRPFPEAGFRSLQEARRRFVAFWAGGGSIPRHQEAQLMSSAATTQRTGRVHLPILETLTIVGLIGIAWVHILDLSGKMEETPYLGFGYIGLIAGCVAATVLLTRRDHHGFLLAGGLAAATFLGYCLS